MDSRRLPHAAAVLAAAAILVATLIPDRSAVPAEELSRVGREPWQLADFLRNVALFAPLGVSLAWNRARARRAILLGAALSAFIELAQIAIPGRDPGPSDWIANTAGLALGFGAFQAAPTWLHPAPARARRLALTAGAAAAAILWSTGILLAPAPSDATFYAHHVPSLPHLAPYGGTVLDASIDDIEIPRGGPIPDTDGVRARLRGEYSLRADLLAGAPPDDLAAFVLITDAEQTENLLLGPDRDDLVFRFRTRGRRLGLETAPVRLPHALHSIAPGDRLSLGVQRIGVDLCVAIDGVADCGHGSTAGDGWRLVAPDLRILASWRTVLDVAWVAALFVPLGYWGRPDTASAIGWALAASALFLAPPATDLLPTPAFQVTGAGLGAGLGIAARRHFATLSRHQRGGR